MRVIVVAMVFLLCGCGIQGDLYLPEDPSTKRPVDRSQAPITVDEELPDDI